MRTRWHSDLMLFNRYAEPNRRQVTPNEETINENKQKSPSKDDDGQFELPAPDCGGSQFAPAFHGSGSVGSTSQSQQRPRQRRPNKAKESLNQMYHEREHERKQA